MTEPRVIPLDENRHEELVSFLDKTETIISSWHYGSSLRSDYRPLDSDIDILIVIKDDTKLEEYVKIVQDISVLIPTAEVTILRLFEVTSRIHPGWSSHFFINVSRSGLLLSGPNLLDEPTVLDFEQAHRRITQLCQRIRLVVANPKKSNEGEFWFSKYQKWVPYCLMEILDMCGNRVDEPSKANEEFAKLFPKKIPEIAYPYKDLPTLLTYMESLTFWLEENKDFFLNLIKEKEEREKNG